MIDGEFEFVRYFSFDAELGNVDERVDIEVPVILLPTLSCHALRRLVTVRK